MPGLQAAAACPLQCTAQSPNGCAQRFLCANGCPVCEPPPANAACYGYRRVRCSLTLLTLQASPSRLCLWEGPRENPKQELGFGEDHHLAHMALLTEPASNIYVSFGEFS